MTMLASSRLLNVPICVSLLLQQDVHVGLILDSSDALGSCFPSQMMRGLKSCLMNQNLNKTNLKVNN